MADCQLGFNLRSIVHWADDDRPARIPDHLTLDHVRATLDRVRQWDGSLVRVWVGNSNVPHAEAAERLARFLDLAQERDLKVIAALHDLYWPKDATGAGWLVPAGMRDQYEDETPAAGELVLGEDFFETAYRDLFLPFVRAVVDRNKGHAALYAWEPGNELRSSSIIPFLQDVAERIHTLDPDTPIAAGLINASHARRLPYDANLADELYPELPLVHFGSIHHYPGDPAQFDNENGLHLELQKITALGKEVIVGELGIPHTHLVTGAENRVQLMQEELDQWRSSGAAAILAWSWPTDNPEDDNYGPLSLLEAEQVRDVFRDFA
jgi:hypothetical protein